MVDPHAGNSDVLAKGHKFDDLLRTKFSRIFSLIGRIWCPALAILGTGLAAIGTYFGEQGLTLLGAIVAALSAGLSSVMQAELGERLEATNEKLRERTEELTAHVTGGDGFVYLAAEGMTGFAIAVNQGRHPLYGVTCSIVDLSIPFSGENPFSDRINLNIGEIAPSSAMLLKSLYLPKNNAGKYNIFFSARNGFWHQQLRFQPVGAGWKHATRVFTRGSAAAIYEKIDDNYPRNTQGDVDWE